MFSWFREYRAKKRKKRSYLEAQNEFREASQKMADCVWFLSTEFPEIFEKTQFAEFAEKVSFSTSALGGVIGRNTEIWKANKIKEKLEELNASAK